MRSSSDAASSPAAAPDAAETWGSRVMKAQTDGAALFTQQTTKPVRWLDRSNASTGERRTSITGRCGCSANLPFKPRRRAELWPCRFHRSSSSSRAGLAVLVQNQSHLPRRQPRRVSDQVYIPPPSPRFQWILLLWRRLGAELPALPEASDGWQSDADSEPHRPGDESRPTAHGWGARRRTGDAPAARWALQALCIHKRWLTANTECTQAGRWNKFLITKSSDKWWSDKYSCE